MNDWEVRTKEELIIAVSEDNSNQQIDSNWMVGRYIYFIINKDLDTIGYRGLVATREEINHYSLTGSFLKPDPVVELNETIDAVSDQIRQVGVQLGELESLMLQIDLAIISGGSSEGRNG